MDHAMIRACEEQMKKIYIIAFGALLLMVLLALPVLAQEIQHAPISGRALMPDAAVVGARGNALGQGQSASVGLLPVQTKKTVKVALLLPLTGRNATMGQALQNAASLALFDKYAQLSRKQQETKVELLAKDTGDSPELARAAMQQALDAGAAVVIGPVFSDTTEVVAPMAAAKQIPLLSFSNKRARSMPGTYMLGFSPQEQAFKIVTYAIEHKRKRIAILAPKTMLGDEVIAAARTAANNAGVKIVAEQQYAPQGAGLEKTLAALVPEGSPPNFDALLIAEGGAPLDTIMRALSTRRVTPLNVQFLGIGLWDDVALRRRVNLDGAWFASSPPEMTEQFETRFQETYGYAAPRISSLAYDAVALAVAIAVTGRPYTGEVLHHTRGFTGPANGLFRLMPSGAVERGLAVIRVEGSALRTLERAPTGF
jgi:branched-chain amino acid transport system substrate-binding protein